MRYSINLGQLINYYDALGTRRIITKSRLKERSAQVQSEPRENTKQPPEKAQRPILASETHRQALGPLQASPGDGRLTLVPPKRRVQKRPAPLLRGTRQPIADSLE